MKITMKHKRNIWAIKKWEEQMITIKSKFKIGDIVCNKFMNKKHTNKFTGKIIAIESGFFEYMVNDRKIIRVDILYKLKTGDILRTDKEESLIKV